MWSNHPKHVHKDRIHLVHPVKVIIKEVLINYDSGVLVIASGIFITSVACCYATVLKCS